MSIKLMRSGMPYTSAEEIEEKTQEETILTNNQHGLSQAEKTVKLTECTLEQFGKAQQRTSIQDSLVRDFFDGQYVLLSEDYVPYKHNITQYSLFPFMEAKNFKLVKELSIKDDAFIVKPKKSTLQISYDKTIEIYSTAFLFFQNDFGEKICFNVYEGWYSPNNFYYEIMLDVKDHTAFMKEFTEYVKKNNFYKGKKVDASCDFLKIGNVSWKDIILPSKIETSIKNNVQNLIKIKTILEINGVALKRGIIFSGTPGNGKTMICKAIANETDATVLYVLPTHIKSQQDIARICDMAKDLSPTILVLEDIDYLAEDRDSSNNWLVIDLMNKLDGIEDFCDVITIATTNLVEKIEKAIKNRPGRFDRVIEIPAPSEDSRRSMISKFTEKYIVKCNEEQLSKIVKKTKNMSGAFVKDICITAVVNAIYDGSLSEDKKAILLYKHFEKAIEEINDRDLSQFDESRPKKLIGFGSSDDD